jgi:hypothetical protein
MTKLKVSLKITGFELNIEGERSEVPEVARSLGNQISDLILGSASAADGLVQTPVSFSQVASVDDQNRGKRRKTSSRVTRKEIDSSSRQASLEWNHDPSKFGNPIPEWNTLEKCIWLLYVVKESANVNQCSASAIAEAFGQKFRQQGPIRGSNVSKYLGQAKSKTKDRPALVSDDTSKNPSEWYLLDAGIKMAQDLVGKVT